MADKIVYPAMTRIRCDGETYVPKEFISLSDKDAARLLALGAIGEPKPSETVDASEGQLDLQAALSRFMDDGKDIANMNMADIGKLLGKGARGVKRNDVDGALAAIKKDTAGGGAT